MTKENKANILQRYLTCHNPKQIKCQNISNKHFILKS